MEADRRSDAAGSITTYTYDAEDRVASITTPWGGVIRQTYDSAGRPSKLAMPNGFAADITFEAQTGRVATIRHAAGALAAPVASFSHTYDVRGNLKALAELGATKTYTYDQIERLTAVARAAANGSSTPAEAYSYDGEGNRVTSQSEGGPAQSYVTDAANRVIDDGVYAYTWHKNNALASRTPKSGGPTQTFGVSQYGALNQVRLDFAGNVPDGAGGTRGIAFYYDPLNRLQEYSAPQGSYVGRFHDGADVVLEYRRAAGQWARYVHAPMPSSSS